VCAEATGNAGIGEDSLEFEGDVFCDDCYLETIIAIATYRGAEIERLNARVGTAYKILRELSDENTYRLIECGVVSIEIQIEDWLKGDGK
jgi:hypothetical protein